MQTHTLWLAAALLTAAPATLAQTPAAAPTAPNAQTYTLRYKFKPGDINYYKVTMNNNGLISGGPGGQSIPLKQHMVFIYHQTVTGVSAADGAATLVTKFDSLDMTMNGQPLPNVAAMSEQFKSRSITTTVSPTGKVSSVKVEGPDSGAMPGMDFSKMANFQGAAQLPERPVKVGDNWKGAVEMNGAFGPQMTGVQATVASTLTSVESSAGETVASINQVTNATFDSAPLPGAAAMSITGSVTGTGTLKFDADAGVVVGQTSHVTLDMTMTPKTGTTTGRTGPMKMQFQINTVLENIHATMPLAVSPASFTKPGPGGSYLYGGIF